MGLFASVPELDQFEPKELKCGNNILIYSDSQDLIQNVLSHFKDINVCLMMGSNHTNYIYNLPETFIHDEYDSKVTYDAMVRQQSLSKIGRNSKLLMILDNVDNGIISDYKEHLGQETVTNVLICNPHFPIDNTIIDEMDHIIIGSVVWGENETDLYNTFFRNVLSSFFASSDDLEDICEHYIDPLNSIVISKETDMKLYSYDKVMTIPKIGDSWFRDWKNNMNVD